jgi:hypothetical protein
MEAVRRTLLKSRIRNALNKPKANHAAFHKAHNAPTTNRAAFIKAHADLVALSRWPNKKNANVHEVISNILNRAKHAKAVAESRKNASRRLVSLVNNAAIVLDPLGHKPPANKYKGFMQRYGRYLNYARKRTIVTKAPYKPTSNANYHKRYPNKLDRVMSSKSKPHEILAEYFFPKGPRPVEYLGGGVDGKVYTTNDGRIMKFIRGSAPQEYTALRNLQKTGLVPSFRDGNGKVFRLFPDEQTAARKMFGNTSTQMTALIMGRAGGPESMTLRKYIKTHPAVNKANIAQRLRSAVNTLGLKGISHGNMHDENIIVEVDSTGRIRRMWLIDFGRANKIPIGQTARNMLAVSTAILVRRGVKPVAFSTYGPYGTRTNVPLAGTEQNRRIDPHMFAALTGNSTYTRANEARIRNNRKLVAGMKNRPRVTTPARRAKSASPSRSTSNTPRGSPKSTRASPRRSPPRPRSAA